MKPSDKKGSLTYVVSEFRPTTVLLRAHWFNLLTTTDKAKAERLCAKLAKGRIETFPRKGKPK